MIALFFLTQLTSAQTSLKEFNLEFGPYSVGFEHFTQYDSSRTYSRVSDYSNSKIPRPISTSIWYPSKAKTGGLEPLTVLNYWEVLKEEEEWEHLPNEFLLDWFYYSNTPENQAHMKESTLAFKALPKAEGKFPVILYTPSFQASSIENFAFCEFLASHGYLVISGPSRGTDTRWFGNSTQKEMHTQARDVEFLLAQLSSNPMADLEKIAVAGFSFGGLSNVIASVRNKQIKANLSLDGTERYHYEWIAESPFYSDEKMDIPYLHLAQKKIPDSVMKADGLDPSLENIFPLYDSIGTNDTYKLQMNDLTHSYFATMGILFGTRDPRQDKSDREIMDSYKLVCQYGLNFLNAYLKEDKDALAFIQAKPESNGIENRLISFEMRKGPKKEYSFEDFNDYASANNYQNLKSLYEESKSKHPELMMPEGKMNSVGLQLVFNPETSQKGIDMFLLALELYPESANLYDSLAEGYLFIGEKEKAIQNFEKSLELYPQNTNAIKRLKQLKK